MSKRPIRCSVFLAVAAFLAATSASAEQFTLKSGDRVTGTVLFEDEREVVVRTEGMGDVAVRRDHVKTRLKTPAVPAPEAGDKAAPASPPAPRLWRSEVAVGYDRRGGNTTASDLYLRFKTSRKTARREFRARGESYYSSTRNRMTGQRLYGQAYYAPSFGPEGRWYNFYKVEGDRDRFARIDYRFTPSTGLGYWFSQKPPLKMLAEFGAGFTHTNFRVRPEDRLVGGPRAQEDRTEFVLVPRLFFERQLSERLRFSQDLTVYPSLTETGEFRLRSETVLQNVVSERVSLRFGIVDEYNSNPVANAKKNDVRFVTSLVYSF